VSDHPAKGHTIAAIIMVLIIAGLATWGFGIMNQGNTAAASAVGVLLAGIGLFGVLRLARDDA
jgi:hypothetical protein